MPKGSPSSEVGDYRLISIKLFRLPSAKAFEKIVAWKLSQFVESNRLLPSSQFAYRRGLKTCDVLLTLSHHLQAALDRGMERRLVQLDLSIAFDRVSHYGLLYKLRSVGVGGQFLSSISEFLSDRRQGVHLDGKVS